MVTGLMCVLVGRVNGQLSEFHDGKIPSGWKVIGQSQDRPDGLILGPSVGEYGISGVVQSEFPIISTNERAQVSVKLSSFQVDRPAPDEIENENDIRLNILLTPNPVPAWENPAEVFNVALLYNSRNRGIFCGLFAKGSGRPQEAPEWLENGLFLGENLGGEILDVAISLRDGKVQVVVNLRGNLLGELNAPLSGPLEWLASGQYYVLVYLQNIGDGSGSVKIHSIAVE